MRLLPTSRIILDSPRKVFSLLAGFGKSQPEIRISGVSSFSTVATSQFTRPERPRRSLLSVPGSDPRKIQKATGLNADVIVLDLEDGVPRDRKDDARRLVVETLQQQEQTQGSLFGTAEVCVRINGLETGKLALDDLQAILPLASLQSIVVPKIEHPSDIDFVSRLIAMSSSSRESSHVRILAAIESAKGILNLTNIAQAGTSGNFSYLDALIFASEDYCADLELIRTSNGSPELQYARSHLVTVAKAYGLQAIDMVHIDFRNLEDLQRECQQGREMGFTGKQAIHPVQLDTIHRTFAPSEKDITFARKCVHEYEFTTLNAGKGACVVDGIVVDAPVYKWAIKILHQAEKSGIIN